MKRSPNKRGAPNPRQRRAFDLIRVCVTAAILPTLVLGCGKQNEKQYEQVSVPPGAPECVVRVVQEGASLDLPKLDKTVWQFAKSNAFRECVRPRYRFYSGPGYPEVLYTNDQFKIWSWFPPNGVFHIAPRIANYNAGDFDRLTNALVTTVSAAFPGRVEVNPTNELKR